MLVLKKGAARVDCRISGLDALGIQEENRLSGMVMVKLSCDSEIQLDMKI